MGEQMEDLVPFSKVVITTAELDGVQGRSPRGVRSELG